jgi:membrane protein
MADKKTKTNIAIKLPPKKKSFWEKGIQKYAAETWASLKYYLTGLFSKIDEHHIFLLSSGLAFSFFICIIPFNLILFSILGNILNSGEIRDQINAFIDNVIPYAEYADYVKSIISSKLFEFVKYKNTAGIVGILGLLFTASGLFNSMRTILNRIFGVAKDLNFILGLLKDFALVFLVIIFFFFTIIVFPFFEVIIKAATSFQFLGLFSFSYFQKLLWDSLSFLLMFLTFAVIYYVVPIIKMRPRVVMVSAFWASVLWQAAKIIFGIYVYNFASFGKIYGAYALIAVVAFWIYYSSIIFVVGGEIGLLYIQRREKKNKKISKN